LHLSVHGFMPTFPERQRMESIKETKKQLEEAKYALEVAQRDGQFDRASQLRYSTIPDLERKLPHHDSDGSSPFGTEESTPGLTIHDRVTSGDIARVVAKATGMPQTIIGDKFILRYLILRHSGPESSERGEREVDSDGGLAANEGGWTRSRVNSCQRRCTHFKSQPSKPHPPCRLISLPWPHRCWKGKTVILFLTFTRLPTDRAMQSTVQFFVQ